MHFMMKDLIFSLVFITANGTFFAKHLLAFENPQNSILGLGLLLAPH